MNRSWTASVLLLLLVLLALGAGTFDRATWPGLVGDESTYLVQAESLAFDQDLLFERGDHDRFVAHWGHRPEGLILQSGDGGQRITFGKPFFYALYLAPFVRVSPTHGPFVANALLLAFTALVVARRLRPALGPAAPLWVAVWLFASVAFAYTFWAHADLFLMCLVAIALALVVRGSDEDPVGAGALALAGALLAAVVFSRPPYAPILLPVIVAALQNRQRRLRSLLALAAAAALVVLVAAAIHIRLGGSWTGYGGERRGFYGTTGFPGVDLPASGWNETLERFNNSAWRSSPAQLLAEKKVDAKLWGWNSVYFLVGRNVGVLPYYLPLLLALAVRPRGAAAWSLAAAVALATALFFFVRPFNFYGGGGAIANRYFLPLYPALWMIAATGRRPLATGRGIAAALVVVLAAAPFLVQLWRSPRAYPLDARGAFAWVADAAAVLPPETSQSHLKPGGREDVVHGGLWLRFLTPAIAHDPATDQLRLAPGERGELLVGSPTPLRALTVTLVPAEGAALAVSGAARDMTLTATTVVPLRGPTAVHPMWWTWDDYYLYHLRVATPTGAAAERVDTAFTLAPDLP